MKEQFRSPKLDGNITITMVKGTDKVWRADKRSVLDSIVSVCEDYDRQGYRLTLRQAYYQLVAADLIPNHDKVYKKLSSLKDEVVYNGMVDWNIFEDRGRVPQRAYFENSVQGALGRAKSYYALDKQLGQPKHIEVWTEKDAISAILKRVTNPLTIHLVVNKGYSSSTAMYKAYERFMEAIEEGKRVVILYFGDHDPSGLDMIRDIRERIMYFMTEGDRKEDEEFEEKINAWGNCLDEDGNETWTDVCWEYVNDEDCQQPYDTGDEKGEYFCTKRAFFKHHFQVRPIGLTMEQIKKYNPPHNPAKLTDPRAKWYVEKFGQRSWEVDALSPVVMTEIVETAIYEEMDQDILKSVQERESVEIAQIDKIIKSVTK